MTNKPDNLDSLTDAELSEAFATEVAGWRRETEKVGGRIYHWKGEHGECCGCVRDYATDANAVLPFIPTAEHITFEAFYGSCWNVRTWNTRGWRIDSDADTFPRAACIALIRAKRDGKQQQKQLASSKTEPTTTGETP